MISATAVTGSDKDKPKLFVLSMIDEDNGTFDSWLFHDRAKALAHFRTSAEADAAKGWFRPDAEDPDGEDDCPRQGIAEIVKWFDAHGRWYYTEGICWRLTERPIEDGALPASGRADDALTKTQRRVLVAELASRFMDMTLNEPLVGSRRHVLAVIGERGFRGYNAWSDGELIREAKRAGITLPTATVRIASRRAYVLCERFNVSLVEAEEPDVAGEWNWLHADRASEGFPSKAEAARNAVRELGLLHRSA